MSNFDYAVGLELRNLFLLIGRLSGGENISHSRLDASMKYIHAHLPYEIKVETLAAMEFLGVSRYREIFKELTGVSPGVYITNLRLSKAKNLLAQGDISLAEVAERVGYKDRLYFQRIFKKYVGITPGEFRDI